MDWQGLQAALVAYVHRNDTAGVLPLFLPLAEQRIYFGEASCEPLRLASMVKTTTLANGQQPADYLAARQVTSTGVRPTALDYRPMDRLTSSAYAYSWNGRTLVTGYGQAFPLTLDYYARFDPLDPAVPTSTNWLLENAPALYVNSFLVELGKWSRDDALAARAAADYASSAQSLVDADRLARASGSLLTARLRP